MNGTIIVIEGLDGCGKQTQVELLEKYFYGKNIKVKKISFPDYDSPSSSLVKMYLNSEFGKSPNDVNAYAAASFYAIDRYASYKKNWHKNYINGDVIICDRYTTANAFYKMSKIEKADWENFLTWLYDYEYNKLGLPRPNKVIYLNLPIEISQQLMKKRYNGNENKKDLHESNINFLTKCREAAEYISKKDKWKVMDCSIDDKIKNKSEIHQEIISYLRGDIFNGYEF